MNKFLKQMDITFRRDRTHFRPRINKFRSENDKEQTLAGNYFLMGDGTEEDEMKATAAKKNGQGRVYTAKERMQ